ncbi:retrovirus-related pol polyprotein from transposon TNT 1-94 [Tanacetum coccineum]
MDSMIPNGQKNTLAEYMILSGADNRPPMLDNPLYNSWKSRMELYMQNREHGRMILESVEHGPLDWPSIEVDGVTRLKKYAKLSVSEKLQANCDHKSTSVILQGLLTDVYALVNHHRIAKDLWEQVQLLMQVNTKFLNSLPPEWSKFMTDVKLVRDLHTTNFHQPKAYLEQHEMHVNEVRIMRERNQDPLALSPQYGSIHPTQYYSSTYPTAPCLNAYSSAVHQEGRQSSFTAGTSGKRANISGIGGNNSGQQRVVKCFNCQMEGHMERQYKKPKRKRDATWLRDKVFLVEGQGSTYQADDLDACDSDCDDFSTAKAVLMANLSSYGSNVLSEVPHFENTHNDMLNQSVQERPYSEQTHLVNYLANEITSDSNIIPYS